MKVFLLSFFVLMAATCCAQKQYVNIFAYSDRAPNGSTSHYPDKFVLSGKVPSDIRRTSIGVILNDLSENGFELEHVSAIGYSDESSYLISGICYVLSKKQSSNESAIQRVIIDEEEPKEVARYNLQGMPVNETEKGIQIIVFSNYTTKTIIVQ